MAALRGREGNAAKDLGRLAAHNAKTQAELEAVRVRAKQAEGALATEKGSTRALRAELTSVRAAADAERKRAAATQTRLEAVRR